MTNRRSVFAAACVAVLIFGIVLTMLGAVLPSIIERFVLDKAAAGTLFPLLSFGVLSGSLVFGPLVDRYGYRWLLLAAGVVIVLALEGMAFATSMGALRATVFLIGFGGGVINGAANALAADISAEGERGAAISVVGIFFGLGAMGVPFILAMLLDDFSYTLIVASVGAAVAMSLAFIGVTRYPAPKQAQGFPIAEGIRLLRDPVLLLFGLILFLESGVELTVGGWTTTFFSEELGLTADRALVFLSLYWLGMMLARIALVPILRRSRPVPVLLACIAIAVVGAFLMIESRNVASAAAGVFLLGVGFSATFPVILGLVGDRYPHLSGTAYSVMFAMALTGGMTLPYVTGVLGARLGLRTSFLIVPAALVGIVALLGAAVRGGAPYGAAPTSARAQTTYPDV
ncbi:MAG TPA: MFS transporter [Thermoanaerobaculia bacterium]|nr:MFS transporter [Thermoanaerobaculia bacterium]